MHIIILHHHHFHQCQADWVLSLIIVSSNPSSFMPWERLRRAQTTQPSIQEQYLMLYLLSSNESSSKRTTRKPRSQERRIYKVVFLEVANVCAVICTHTSTCRTNMRTMDFWTKGYHVLMDLFRLFISISSYLFCGQNNSPSYKTRYPSPTPNPLRTSSCWWDNLHKLSDSDTANLCHCNRSLLWYKCFGLVFGGVGMLCPQKKRGLDVLRWTRSCYWVAILGSGNCWRLVSDVWGEGGWRREGLVVLTHHIAKSLLSHYT